MLNGSEIRGDEESKLENRFIVVFDYIAGRSTGHVEIRNTLLSSDRKT